MIVKEDAGNKKGERYCWHNNASCRFCVPVAQCGIKHGGGNGPVTGSVEFPAMCTLK